MSPDDPDCSATEELAAALRRLRADAGVSGADLAARIGTSQATISRYESGRLQPSMLTAGRIGCALRAPMSSGGGSWTWPHGGNRIA